MYTTILHIQELIEYWRTDFDWTVQQSWLNSHFRHFQLRIGDIDLHYVHHPSKSPQAIPLLMVHGWPGSFMDFHKVLPKLQQEGQEHPASNAKPDICMTSSTNSK